MRAVVFDQPADESVRRVGEVEAPALGPHVLRIRLGILNGDPGRRPLAHFHVASKAPWFEIADALPQFAGGSQDCEVGAARRGSRPT